MVGVGVGGSGLGEVGFGEVRFGSSFRIQEGPRSEIVDVPDSVDSHSIVREVVGCNIHSWRVVVELADGFGSSSCKRGFRTDFFPGNLSTSRETGTSVHSTMLEYLHCFLKDGRS